MKRKLKKRKGERISGRDELEGCKHRQKEKERSEWLVKGSKWEEYMSRRECENFGRDK